MTASFAGTSLSPRPSINQNSSASIPSSNDQPIASPARNTRAKSKAQKQQQQQEETTANNGNLQQQQAPPQWGAWSGGNIQFGD